MIRMVEGLTEAYNVKNNPKLSKTIDQFSYIKHFHYSSLNNNWVRKVTKINHVNFAQWH